MKQKKASKIISLIFISAIILSFLNLCLFFSPVASASSQSASMDCGKLMNGDLEYQMMNNSDTQNSVMPCCVNSHDNQKANIKINNNYDPEALHAATINSTVNLFSPDSQINHSVSYSSSSPPHEFLSSILKKE